MASNLSVSPYTPYTPWSFCSAWQTELVPTKDENFTFDDLAIFHPAWHEMAQSVGRSVASVTARGGLDLGCAVLVGIDRLLLPYHILSSHCLADLKVEFVIKNQWTGITYALDFSVQRMLYGNIEDDFCLLQLDPQLFDGSHAGHYVPPVAISTESYQGEFMFVHHLSSGGHMAGQKEGYVATIGSPCEELLDRSGYFCSTSPTEAGSSGGVYFDKLGRVFAMHLARATGLCSVSKERKAIYLSEIMQKIYFLLEIPRCTPICQAPKSAHCFAHLRVDDLCYSDEGGRPVVRSTITEAGKEYAYWEMRDVGSRRGIRIAVKSSATTKEKGKSVTRTVTEFDEVFTLQPDPHTVAAYNKDQTTFYETAARTFIRLPPASRKKWSFTCFKAAFEGVSIGAYR